MKKNLQLLAAMSAMLTVGAASAQDVPESGERQVRYYTTSFEMSPTSVSNDGIAVGGYGKDTPFLMWNPMAKEATDIVRVIGGMSAGDDGAAGPARISADGKTVIGSNWSDEIPVPTTWDRAQYDKYPFTYTAYARGNDFNLFLTGYNHDDDGVTRSYTLKSANNGKSWSECYDYFPENRVQGAVTDMSCMTAMMYFITSDAGKIYFSPGNPQWTAVDVRAVDDERAIKSFTTLEFARTDAPESAEFSYGAIGFECEDGSFGTWYTEDCKYKITSGSFHLSTGVAGVPAHITHVGETFYMVTKNGYIQKSTDKGATWTNCYEAEGVGFRKIAFADADNGIAIADQLVLLTADGGETWKVAVVEGGGISPFADEEAPADEWNDVLWADGFIALAGNNGRFYLSMDNGASFTRETIDGSSDNDNFTLIMFHKNVFNLFADNGGFYRKTFEPNIAGYVPSRYDVEADEWTPMDVFGIVGDRQAGSSWGISPDGRYTAGIAKIFDADVNKAPGYAAIWDGYSVTSLGTMFPGMPNRANRVSADGSVVVGFQDKMGPWTASVWRRQDDGTYSQSLMFKNPDLTVDDVDMDNFNAIIENSLGNALAVSQNGKWIGGTGGSWYAVDGAWIWSEENGLEELGIGGATVEVAEDGSMAVGRGDGGFGAWIWFREDGRTYDLYSYAMDHGAEDPDGRFISGFYAMSPNGRFLVGYAYDAEMTPHGYMVDLKPESGNIERMADDQVKAAVYPNPVVSELHVDLPYDGETVGTVITLYNMQGGVCRTLTDCRQSNIIDVNGLASGIYMLDVRSGRTHKVFKVVVK